MQFTPQQLAGAQRYGSKTRVGNWQEDNFLEETKLGDFRRSQGLGRLLMNDMRSKEVNYNKRVPLVTARKGQTCFGDTVMLCSSGALGHAVAVDLTESIFECDGGSKLVTAMRVDPSNPQPIARNVFTIVGEEQGRPIRFGETFRLRCSEHLASGAWYLASTLKNERNASRIANQQPVFMTQREDASSVWSFAKIPQENTRCGITRMLATDEQVPASSSVVLQHRQTMQALSTNAKFVDSTDFGRELEIACHNNFGSTKVEALSSECKGRTTGATNARLEKPFNWWTVVGAEEGSMEEEEEKQAYEQEEEKEEFPPPTSLGSIVDAARFKLSELGLDAAEALLKIADVTTVINKLDLAFELRAMGLDLPPSSLDTLLGAFDTTDDGQGVIHLPTFIDAMLNSQD